MLSATGLDEGTFVAVDIETTGSRPGIHAIIEIGAVKIDGGRVVGTFSELVRPGHTIPPAISTLTGISDEMVADAPDVTEMLARFLEFAEGAVLVAHNHRFDLSFLDWETERATGSPLQRPVLDTLALARRLHPTEDRHNLRDLAARYGVRSVPTHRALADAGATAEIFTAMRGELRARGLETAGQVAGFCGLDEQGALARRLVLTTGLTDAPGVYIFRDEADRVLHIGRASDLRVRVRGYFYATASPSSVPVGLAVERIETIPCVSDLDAMLLESRLIGRYRPPFNATVLRGDAGVFVLHADTGVRYPSLRVTSKRPKRGVVLGPFTSRTALETVVELARLVFGLRRCQWRLTSDTARRPCLHRDQGTCPAPCLGMVDHAEYRRRIEAALAVFGDDGPSFREELVGRQASAAAGARYEEAIRYRDGIRALDRCLTALRTIRSACAAEGSVIIEGGAAGLTLHFVRHGYLHHTCRLTRDDTTAPDMTKRVARIIERAYHPPRGESDPRAYTARQIRDVFLIEAYRKQHAPLEVAVAADRQATLRRITRAVKRHARVPRKTHAAP